MTGHIDGNALAGALSELFTPDLTTATAVCAGLWSRGRPRRRPRLRRTHGARAALSPVRRRVAALRTDPERSHHRHAGDSGAANQHIRPGATALAKSARAVPGSRDARPCGRVKE